MHPEPLKWRPRSLQALTVNAQSRQKSSCQNDSSTENTEATAWKLDQITYKYSTYIGSWGLGTVSFVRRSHIRVLDQNSAIHYESFTLQLSTLCTWKQKTQHNLDVQDTTASTLFATKGSRRQKDQPPSGGRTTSPHDHEIWDRAVLQPVDFMIKSFNSQVWRIWMNLFKNIFAIRKQTPWERAFVPYAARLYSQDISDVAKRAGPLLHPSELRRSSAFGEKVLCTRGWSRRNKLCTWTLGADARQNVVSGGSLSLQKKREKLVLGRTHELKHNEFRRSGHH